MVRRVIFAPLAVMVLILVVAGGLYLCFPPKALDILNDFFPGDDGVARIVSFMAEPNGQLDA